MKNNHIWSYNEITALRERYQSATQKEIAEELGMTEGQVEGALRRYGIIKDVGKNKRVAPWEIEIVTEMHKTLTRGQIAIKLGMKVGRVKSIISYYGRIAA